MNITQNDLNLISRKEHFIAQNITPHYNYVSKKTRVDTKRYEVWGEMLTVDQILDRHPNASKSYNTIVNRLRKGHELLDILPELRAN